MKYDIVRTQYNSRECIVCGLDNPFGLRTYFYETSGGELLAVCTPINEHQSYPNRLHGGISAALLDETIGRAISINYDDTVWGVTMELNVRYKRPVPLGEPIYVVARITNERSSFFEGTGELLLSTGQVAATAVGKYKRLAITDIASTDFVNNKWGLLPPVPQPEVIIIGENA